MRNPLSARTAIAAIAAALFGGLAFVPAAYAASGGVDSDASASAARSTHVGLDNWTGCDLVRTGAGLDHGVWTAYPPTVIESGRRGEWESESNGFMTGTEGTATYQAHDCDNRSKKNQTVQVHWNNPYAGSNSYNWNGTSSVFRVSYTGGGGNNASVVFRVGTN